MNELNNNGDIMRVKRKAKTYESGTTTGVSSSINNTGAGLLSGGPTHASGRDKRQSNMEPIS